MYKVRVQAGGPHFHTLSDKFVTFYLKALLQDTVACGKTRGCAVTVLCRSGMERSFVCCARSGFVSLQSHKEYLEQ